MMAQNNWRKEHTEAGLLHFGTFAFLRNNKERNGHVNQFVFIFSSSFFLTMSAFCYLYFLVLIDFWERWSNTLSRVLFMETTILTWSTYSSCCFFSTICRSVVDGQSWPWSPKPSQRWHRAETPSWRQFLSIWPACVWFLTTCCGTIPRLPCTYLNRLIAYFLMVFLSIGFIHLLLTNFFILFK